METTPLVARLRDLPLEVVRLASLATNAVAAGTDALLDGDLVNAQRLIDDDDAIDTLRHSIEDDCLEGGLLRHILSATTPDEAVVVRAVQLGLVARHYERIGDHAVTIAEQVHLVVTGQRSPRRRRTRVPVGT